MSPLADPIVWALGGVVALLLVVLALVLRRRRPAERAVEPSKPLPVAQPAAEATPAKEDKPVEPAVTPPPEEEPSSLREGLGKTRQEGFIARLGGLFSKKTLDLSLYEQAEEVLLTADIGVKTSEKLLATLREGLRGAELADGQAVWGALKARAREVLGSTNGALPMSEPSPGQPHVTMVLGVNGTGKTTSIAKLAHQLTAHGHQVLLIAGDTFRAAAAEQLEVWARRVKVPVYRGKEGADPASVVFDGLKEAFAQRMTHVLVDTAGRLHTQVNLMAELTKVRKVMGRAVENAPHEVLMVLDATTGQNAIQQARMFREATEVTGIVLTKLDGTAKGGVVLGICDELRIPIRYIGIGERVGDLRPFDADEFVEALFGAPLTTAP
jgi:fused signal recognition particle receptor